MVDTVSQSSETLHEEVIPYADHGYQHYFFSQGHCLVKINTVPYRYAKISILLQILAVILPRSNGSDVAAQNEWNIRVQYIK